MFYISYLLFSLLLGGNFDFKLNFFSVPEPSVSPTLLSTALSLSDTVVKQSGFLCCWSYQDYLDVGEKHAMEAARAYTYAAGLSSDPSIKGLAHRAAEHSQSAHLLGHMANR